MANSAGFPITITKVMTPECFNGREVPGPNMSAEAKSFTKMCEELNHCLSDQRSPLNLSISGVSPNEAESGEVFVVRRPDDKKWYRATVKTVTRRLQGPEALCDLLDFGVELKVPLSSLRKLPEKFRSFPFQVKQFGLFGLQPQTLVTCPEDMTSSYQLCSEWDLSASTYMRKVLSEARDIRAEVIGVTEDHVQWVRIHFDHIDGNCLNEILVNNGFACQTKTERDYQFKEIEPFVPYQKTQTKARLPQFATSIWSPSQLDRNDKSDVESTHSEHEGDHKAAHGKKSHSKRIPLIPRIKEGVTSGTAHDPACADSDNSQRLETHQKSTHYESDPGTSSQTSRNSPPYKSVDGGATKRNIGRGFMSPVVPNIEARPQGLDKNLEVQHMLSPTRQMNDIASDNIESSSALKSPLRGIQLIRGASPGRVLLPVNNNRQPGGLQEKQEEKQAKLDMLSPSQTEPAPLSVDPEPDSVLRNIKSPPRKEMKPHIPAKRSPFRPSADASETETKPRGEGMQPITVETVPSPGNNIKDGSRLLSPMGRGCFKRPEREFSTTPEDAKPGLLQDVAGSGPFSPPMTTQTDISSALACSGFSDGEFVVETIKSPPRKQMKPPVPAKAKSSPARPNCSPGVSQVVSADNDSRSSARSEVVRSTVESVGESPKPLLILPQGRGFLKPAGRGLLRPLDDVKPHGLQEMSKASLKATGTEAETGIQSIATAGEASPPCNVGSGDPATAGRASHRKLPLSNACERKPQGLWKPVNVNENEGADTNAGVNVTPTADQKETVMASPDAEYIRPDSREQASPHCKPVSLDVGIHEPNTNAASPVNAKDVAPSIVKASTPPRISASTDATPMSQGKKESPLPRNLISLGRGLSPLLVSPKVGKPATSRTSVDETRATSTDSGVKMKPASPRRSADESVTSQSPLLPKPQGRGQMLLSLLPGLKAGSPGRTDSEDELKGQRRKESVPSKVDYLNDRKDNPRTSPRLREGRLKVTPERTIKVASLEEHTPPIGLGRGRSLLLLKQQGLSPDKSIKNDIFTSLLDKSSGRNVPPMPAKSKAVYDVSDIESEDVAQVKRGVKRSRVAAEDKDCRRSLVGKRNILGQLMEKSRLNEKSLPPMPKDVDKICSVAVLEGDEPPPLEVNEKVQELVVDKQSDAAAKLMRCDSEAKKHVPDGGGDAKSDHERSSTSNSRTNKINQTIKHRGIDLSSEEELVKIMKGARFKGESRSMLSPEFVRTDCGTPKEIEDVEKLLGSCFSWQSSSDGPSSSSQSPCKMNYVGDEDSGAEDKRSWSPIRSQAEMAWYSADSIHGQDVDRDELVCYPEITDGAGTTSAPKMVPTSVTSNEKTDIIDTKHISDTMHSCTTYLDEEKDSKVKVTKDISIENLQLQDAVQKEIVTDASDISVIDSGNVSVTEPQVDSIPELEINLKPATPELEISTASEVDSTARLDIPARRRSRSTSSSESQRGSDFPDGAAALVSAIQTLIAVASPAIAGSYLLTSSSSVDPDDYVASRTDQNEAPCVTPSEAPSIDASASEAPSIEASANEAPSNEATQIKALEAHTQVRQAVFSDSDSDMPELEADETQESGIDEHTTVTLPESKENLNESVEDMPELEHHVGGAAGLTRDSQTNLDVTEHNPEKHLSADHSEEIRISREGSLHAVRKEDPGSVHSEVRKDLPSNSEQRSERESIEVLAAGKVDRISELESSSREVLHTLESGESEADGQICTDDDALTSSHEQAVRSRSAAQDFSSDTSTSESQKQTTNQGLRSRLPKCATLKKKPSKFGAGSNSEQESKSGNEMKSDEERPRGRPRSVTFSDEEVVLNKSLRGPVESISDEEDEEEKALLREIQERAVRQQQLRLQETFAMGGTKAIAGFANFEYFEKEEEIEDTLEKGVFLDGKCILTTCTRLSDSNLHDSMRVVYTDRQILSTTTLQSYVWPAVNRGLSMVVIARRFTPINTLAAKVDPVIRLTKDVTAAYLPPMISKYLYEGIPEGPGPLGVIICSSWRRVEWVMDQCRSYCSHVRIRTEALYGSCGEESMEVRLLNGCEVLVATPNSLLRMLQKMIIDFNRVMHIVFDDGEVLTEQFREPLTSIMSQYYTDVENRESREPSQLILCGQHWSPAMDDFMTKCIPQPQIVIQAKLEAAIYADTHFVVEMCPPNNRLQHLCNFVLDPGINVTTRTMVCCKERQTAKLVADALTAQTHHVLLALDISLPEELEKVRHEWKSSGQSKKHKPILVATDTVLEELQIDDVERVIHYDLPTKAAFKARLWAMRTNYAKLAKKVKDASVQSADPTPKLRCLSVTLMTDDDIMYAPAVVELLRRCQAKVPRYLDALAEKARSEKEEFSQVPLCQHMCAFGVCRLGRQCQGRHVINADFDAKTPSHTVQLPKKGYVKIKVMHVVDANFFWARLIHHTDHSVNIMYNLEFAKMTFVLNSILATPSARKPIVHPSKGDLIAVEDIQHTWHRAKILSLGKFNKEGFIEEVEVFMVDIGELREVRLKYASQLPEHSSIIQVQYQAFRVFIADVKPFDNDLEWTKQASLATANKIGDKELNGRIVLTLGETMWLVNVHEQNQLKITVQSETVSMFLVRKKLAVKNLVHIPLLYSACEGKIDLPEVFQVSSHAGVGYDLYQRPVNFETVKLKPAVPEQKIIIPVVESPDLFYAQREDAEKLIMDLHFDIQDHLRLGDIEATTNSLVKAGSLVLARMPSAENPEEEDVKWYRCKVRSVTESDLFEVFYLDFGDIYTVPKERVRPLPLRFLQPEFQVAECQLAGIKPMGETWTDSSVDGMFGIIWNEQDETKILEAKVVGHDKSTTAGLSKYRVELIDNSDEFPVDVAMEMVARRHAAPTPLFLQNLLITNDQDSILELVNLCQKLVITSDAEQQKVVFESIHDCCAAILDEEQDLRLLEVLSHLGRVLGYVPFAQNITGPFSALLDMLLPEVMSEEIQAGVEAIILNLFRILRRIDDNNGKCDAIVSLIKLASNDSCQKYMRSECNAMKFLTKMLLANMEGDLALLLVKLLYSLLPEALSYVKGILESGVIKAICQCLASANDEDLIGWCCMALQHPATHDRWNEEIRKAKLGSKLCKALVEGKDGKILSRIIELIEILCETNKITAEYFQDCDLQDRLEILKARPRLEESLRKSVEDLLILTQMEEDGFVVEVDMKSPKKAITYKKQVLNTNNNDIPGMRALPPVAPERITDPPNLLRKRQAPQVKWTQDKYNIVLRVDVHDVRSSEPVKILDKMVTFSALVLGTEYFFNFDLYELIIPEHCQVEILNSSVNIGLRKRTKCTWPRLLKQKTVKLSYLSVDFDHGLTTDSESDNSGDDDDSKPPLAPPLCLIKRRRGGVRPLPLPQEKNIIKLNDFSNIIPSIPEFDYQPAEKSSDSSNDAVVEREYDQFNIFDVKNN